MTVEKDITELSEEIFIRRYPEYVMNGEPLSPYYDLFASGYEIAIMEMRKRIAELEKENAELKEVHESDKRSLRLIAEKGADLEREISILLSCKNCPDNKGGYICQKEYEDKCLAQKIQYIKELKAYNEKLLDGDIEKHNKIVEMGKENSRLKQIILGNEMEIAAKDETIEDLFETNQRLKNELDTPVYDKLDKAKELIKRLIKETYGEGWNYSLQVKVEAEQFLKECE